MASKLFPSLAATAFAAMLSHIFLKRRSREINGGEAKNNAAANDGTAGGASGTYTSTEVPEMPTSSGSNKDAAANDGTARGDSVTHTSTEVHEMATSSRCDYEVFLSFRGSDTLATFTDHLYTRLEDAGIRTFKDDEILHKGEEFAPELLQCMVSQGGSPNGRVQE
ncbi:disease resistance protein L6-like [Syzygium oleosum]|uniref:disease resistance protein L6-like n=1 Tax=Syzygium oleosum TaxID=219896 RepID=UPI0024B8AE99|nr:disease resistance protein L6-like [Syzygium oleosum]